MFERMAKKLNFNKVMDFAYFQKYTKMARSLIPLLGFLGLMLN